MRRFRRPYDGFVVRPPPVPNYGFFPNPGHIQRPWGINANQGPWIRQESHASWNRRGPPITPGVVRHEEPQSRKQSFSASAAPELEESGSLDNFYCKSCKVQCNGPVTFKLHCDGNKHKRALGNNSKDVLENGQEHPSDDATKRIGIPENTTEFYRACKENGTSSIAALEERFESSFPHRDKSLYHQRVTGTTNRLYRNGNAVSLIEINGHNLHHLSDMHKNDIKPNWLSRSLDNISLDQREKLSKRLSEYRTGHDFMSKSLHAEPYGQIENLGPNATTIDQIKSSSSVVFDEIMKSGNLKYKNLEKESGIKGLICEVVDVVIEKLKNEGGVRILGKQQNEFPWTCWYCNVTCNGEKTRQRHLLGKKHRREKEQRSKSHAENETASNKSFTRDPETRYAVFEVHDASELSEFTDDSSEYEEECLQLQENGPMLPIQYEKNEFLYKADDQYKIPLSLKKETFPDQQYKVEENKSQCPQSMGTEHTVQHAYKTLHPVPNETTEGASSLDGKNEKDLHVNFSKGGQFHADFNKQGTMRDVPNVGEFELHMPKFEKKEDLLHFKYENHVLDFCEENQIEKVCHKTIEGLDGLQGTEETEVKQEGKITFPCDRKSVVSVDETKDTLQSPSNIDNETKHKSHVAELAKNEQSICHSNVQSLETRNCDGSLPLQNEDNINTSHQESVTELVCLNNQKLKASKAEEKQQVSVCEEKTNHSAHENAEAPKPLHEVEPTNTSIEKGNGSFSCEEVAHSSNNKERNLEELHNKACHDDNIQTDNVQPFQELSETQKATNPQGNDNLGKKFNSICHSKDDQIQKSSSTNLYNDSKEDETFQSTIPCIRLDPAKSNIKITVTPTKRSEIIVLSGADMKKQDSIDESPVPKIVEVFTFKNDKKCNDTFITDTQELSSTQKENRSKVHLDVPVSEFQRYSEDQNLNLPTYKPGEYKNSSITSEAEKRCDSQTNMNTQSCNSSIEIKKEELHACNPVPDDTKNTNEEIKANSYLADTTENPYSLYSNNVRSSSAAFEAGSQQNFKAYEMFSTEKSKNSQGFFSSIPRPDTTTSSKISSSKQHHPSGERLSESNCLIGNGKFNADHFPLEQVKKIQVLVSENNDENQQELLEEEWKKITEFSRNDDNGARENHTVNSQLPCNKLHDCDSPEEDVQGNQTLENTEIVIFSKGKECTLSEQGSTEQFKTSNPVLKQEDSTSAAIKKEQEMQNSTLHQDLKPCTSFDQQDTNPTEFQPVNEQIKTSLTEKQLEAGKLSNQLKDRSRYEHHVATSTESLKVSQQIQTTLIEGQPDNDAYETPGKSIETMPDTKLMNENEHYHIRINANGIGLGIDQQDEDGFYPKRNKANDVHVEAVPPQFQVTRKYIGPEADTHFTHSQETSKNSQIDLVTKQMNENEFHHKQKDDVRCVQYNESSIQLQEESNGLQTLPFMEQKDESKLCYGLKSNINYGHEDPDVAQPQNMGKNSQIASVSSKLDEDELHQNQKNDTRFVQQDSNSTQLTGINKNIKNLPISKKMSEDELCHHTKNIGNNIQKDTSTSQIQEMNEHKKVTSVPNTPNENQSSPQIFKADRNDFRATMSAFIEQPTSTCEEGQKLKEFEERFSQMTFKERSDLLKKLACMEQNAIENSIATDCSSQTVNNCSQATNHLQEQQGEACTQTTNRFHEQQGEGMYEDNFEILNAVTKDDLYPEYEVESDLCKCPSFKSESQILRERNLFQYPGMSASIPLQSQQDKMEGIIQETLDPANAEDDKLNTGVRNKTFAGRSFSEKPVLYESLGFKNKCNFQENLQLHCQTCNVLCKGEDMLHSHLNSQEHRKNIIIYSATVESRSENITAMSKNIPQEDQSSTDACYSWKQDDELIAEMCIKNPVCKGNSSGFETTPEKPTPQETDSCSASSQNFCHGVTNYSSPLSNSTAKPLCFSTRQTNYQDSSMLKWSNVPKPNKAMYNETFYPAAQSFSCDLCKKSGLSYTTYQAHLRGKGHLRNQRRQTCGFKCSHLMCALCNVQFESLESYRRHVDGKWHNKKQLEVGSCSNKEKSECCQHEGNKECPLASSKGATHLELNQNKYAPQALKDNRLFRNSFNSMPFTPNLLQQMPSMNAQSLEHNALQMSYQQKLLALMKCLQQPANLLAMAQLGILK